MGRSGGIRPFLGRLRNLGLGLAHDLVGWQPGADGRIVGSRAFATARRLGRILGRAGCHVRRCRVTERHLGLPVGFEILAVKP
ncbi:MAG: hypothetical protein WKF75_00965 [Singulisphaera sp.]